MRYVLCQHDETRKERVIYYLSKKFIKYESRYMTIEKLCCALVWVEKITILYVVSYYVVDFNGGSLEVYM
jgi:hypothetical protein